MGFEGGVRVARCFLCEGVIGFDVARNNSAPSGLGNFFYFGVVRGFRVASLEEMIFFPVSYRMLA